MYRCIMKSEESIRSGVHEETDRGERCERFTFLKFELTLPRKDPSKCLSTQVPHRKIAVLFKNSTTHA